MKSQICTDCGNLETACKKCINELYTYNSEIQKCPCCNSAARTINGFLVCESCKTRFDKDRIIYSDFKQIYHS
jgi:hypothetical protein